MYKTRRKVIASLLVFILTMAHFSTLSVAIAASQQAMYAQTNIENVEFDMSFRQGNSGIYSDDKVIGEKNYIYATINVKDAGYLKQARVEIENANFDMYQEGNFEEVSNIYRNTIQFNTIQAGKNIEIPIPITMLDNKGFIPLDLLNRESYVEFEGLYVDENGEERIVVKNIPLYLKWTARPQAEINLKHTKYVQYEENGMPKILVQTVVSSNLVDNIFPVEENKIEVYIPHINGFEPMQVKVSANSTKATNGDDTGSKFTTQNYAYTSGVNTTAGNMGRVTIKVNNRANDYGEVFWEKDAKDEFVITCIYLAIDRNPGGNKDKEVEFYAKNEIRVYGENQGKVENEVTEIVSLQEQKGELAEFSITTETKQVSKGQIYANYKSQGTLETEYQETLSADITLADIVDEITLETTTNKFLYDRYYTELNGTDQTTGMNASYEEIIPNTSEYPIKSRYKTISVNKQEFDKVLGENGQITFYSGATEIAKIDKDTKPEDFTIDLSNATIEVDSLIIKTSKPVAEGKLNFNMQKAIKGYVGYEKEVIKNLNTLRLDLIGKVTSNGQDIIRKEVATNIMLKEPTTQMDFQINKESLSTLSTNTDVKMTTILRTDDIYCNLFKDPTITITLPNCVERIDIKNIEVLFDTEGSKLVLKDYKLQENKPDGTRDIIITLEGNQIEYTLGAISKGVNVIVTADITLDKLTANKQEVITMEGINNNDNELTVGTKSVPINIVAPVGVFTISNISNYVEGGVLTGINEKEKTATIPVMSEAREVTYSMSIINNYNNTIDNISVLGRLPFKGNKDIETQEDLGTTMNMPLTSNVIVNGIATENVKVYYSENGEATKDLTKVENAWTETPANLANVKSYLIVVEHELNTSDRIDFNYKAQIPANLQYNETAFEDYVVYFNNKLTTGTIQDKQASTKLGITTGKGPVLEASMTSSVEETKEVLTGEIIQYTLTVKNIGTETAENVVATIEIPQKLDCVQKNEETGYYETIVTGGTTGAIQIGNIQPNQTVTKVIEMRVGRLSTSEDKLITEIKANITGDKILTPVQTDTVKNTIAKTYFIITPTVLKDKEVLRENDEYTYYLEIIASNIEQIIEESVLEITLPQELDYKDIKVEGKQDKKRVDITSNTQHSYDEKTRKVTINIGDINGEDPKGVYLNVKVGKLAENVYNKEINIEAKVSGKDAREQLAIIKPVQIGKVAFKVTQSSNISENSHITSGEDFKYIFTIENLSNIDLYDVKITDIVPEELTLKNMLATYKDETTKSTYKNSINLSIKGQETIKLEVNVIANMLNETRKISNKATIEYEGIEKVTTPSFTHIIDKFDDSKLDDPEYDPSNPSDPTFQTKRIVGQVWEDENTDGIKDEKEKRISNVELLVFNNATGNLVRNSNGEVIRTTTDENGTYTLSNIPQGKYTVIFLYDTANYSATTYRKENVDETLNSDAIDTKITLDGVTRVAAITEEVRVTDSNVYNIDLGLVSNPKFDLKIDKTVSKITVQDAKGTNAYEFNDSKLAKKDLVGKQIAGTTIIVEYKIKVTNEGAISGFVKKIADYMPQEMKFNSELNKDWYTSDNKVLYNSSLANTIINPGESKEVTLLLTKKMTEDNLGLYHNEAEIYEAYNDLGIEDIDSQEANKTSNEDDISSADVLITVKTGEVIIIIGLIAGLITILTISVYFIKRKILK